MAANFTKVKSFEFGLASGLFVCVRFRVTDVARLVHVGHTYVM